MVENLRNVFILCTCTSSLAKVLMCLKFFIHGSVCPYSLDLPKNQENRNLSSKSNSQSCIFTHLWSLKTGTWLSLHLFATDPVDQPPYNLANGFCFHFTPVTHNPIINVALSNSLSHLEASTSFYQ